MCQRVEIFGGSEWALSPPVKIAMEVLTLQIWVWLSCARRPAPLIIGSKEHQGKVETELECDLSYL